MSKFAPKTKWIEDFSYGWNTQDITPRFIADVDGDGKDDMIGVDISTTPSGSWNSEGGIWVALSTGDSFLAKEKWISFQLTTTWTTSNYSPRFVADVNGDGKADLIGIDPVDSASIESGVWVALSTGNNFTKPTKWISDFSYGWNTQDNTPRFVADVDGDGKADMIGVDASTTPSPGVWVALSTGSNFAGRSKWIGDFAWGTYNNAPRFVADVNGDGKADIIGVYPATVDTAISAWGVWVALSTGSSFAARTKWSDDFSHSWVTQDNLPRFVTDVDDDGKADMIGVDAASTTGGVWVGLSTGSNFAGRSKWIEDFAWGTYNNAPRFVADVNGDGKADIISVDPVDTASVGSGAWVSLSAALSDPLTIDFSQEISAISANLVDRTSNSPVYTSIPATVENIIGSLFADNLIGDNAVNRINGNDGNDVIEGRGGADYIDGGAGNNTASYANSPAAVKVNLNTGVNSGSDAQADVLVNIRNLIGSSYSDSLSGNAFDNYIAGGDGSDTMSNIGGGADLLEGGQGSDRFVISRSPGQVTILDFTSGEDKLDLRAFSEITKLNDIVAISISDGKDTTIELPGAVTLVLQGVSDLDYSTTSSDYIFEEAEDNNQLEWANTITGKVVIGLGSAVSAAISGYLVAQLGCAWKYHGNKEIISNDNFQWFCGGYQWLAGIKIPSKLGEIGEIVSMENTAGSTIPTGVGGTVGSGVIISSVASHPAKAEQTSFWEYPASYDQNLMNIGGEEFYLEEDNFSFGNFSTENSSNEDCLS